MLYCYKNTYIGYIMDSHCISGLKIKNLEIPWERGWAVFGMWFIAKPDK